jgi:hypothetical protein
MAHDFQPAITTLIEMAGQRTAERDDLRDRLLRIRTLAVETLVESRNPRELIDLVEAETDELVAEYRAGLRKGGQIAVPD